MKPEQQRTAIAKTCGWKLSWQNMGGGKLHDLKPTGHCWEVRHPPEGWYSSSAGKAYLALRETAHGDCSPPDYPSDLNAMHEAEKVLTEEQHRRFSWHLVQVTDDNYRTWSAFEYETLSVWEMSLGDVQACLRATAAQRAEAFLRTLNLWTES